MTAKSSGEIILSTSPANNSPGRDILLFGSEEPVDLSAIEFRASQLSILDDAEGEDWSIDDSLVRILSSDNPPDLRSIDDFYGNY